jgi:hypothetical protein
MIGFYLVGDAGDAQEGLKRRARPTSRPLWFVPGSLDRIWIQAKRGTGPNRNGRVADGSGSDLDIIGTIGSDPALVRKPDLRSTTSSAHAIIFDESINRLPVRLMEPMRAARAESPLPGLGSDVNPNEPAPTSAPRLPFCRPLKCGQDWIQLERLARCITRKNVITPISTGRVERRFVDINRVLF